MSTKGVYKKWIYRIFMYKIKFRNWIFDFTQQNTTDLKRLERNNLQTKPKPWQIILFSSINYYYYNGKLTISPIRFI